MENQDNAPETQPEEVQTVETVEPNETPIEPTEPAETIEPEKTEAPEEVQNENDIVHTRTLDEIKITDYKTEQCYLVRPLDGDHFSLVDEANIAFYPKENYEIKIQA